MLPIYHPRMARDDETGLDGLFSNLLQVAGTAAGAWVGAPGLGKAAAKFVGDNAEGIAGGLGKKKKKKKQKPGRAAVARARRTPAAVAAARALPHALKARNQVAQHVSSLIGRSGVTYDALARAAGLDPRKARRARVHGADLVKRIGLPGVAKLVRAPSTAALAQAVGVPATVAKATGLVADKAKRVKRFGRHPVRGAMQVIVNVGRARAPRRAFRGDVVLSDEPGLGGLLDNVVNRAKRAAGQAAGRAVRTVGKRATKALPRILPRRAIGLLGRAPSSAIQSLSTAAENLVAPSVPSQPPGGESVAAAAQALVAPQAVATSGRPPLDTGPIPGVNTDVEEGGESEEGESERPIYGGEGDDPVPKAPQPPRAAPKGSVPGAVPVRAANWDLAGGRYRLASGDTLQGLGLTYLPDLYYLDAVRAIWAAQPEEFRRQRKMNVIYAGEWLRMPPEAVNKARELTGASGVGGVVRAIPWWGWVAGVGAVGALGVAAVSADR
jgi:hypothetical protein